MDWESQDDGFIAKLLVEDGAKDISVGEPVLVFVEDEVHSLLLSTRQHLAHQCQPIMSALQLVAWYRGIHARRHLTLKENMRHCCWCVADSIPRGFPCPDCSPNISMCKLQGCVQESVAAFKDFSASDAAGAAPKKKPAPKKAPKQEAAPAAPKKEPKKESPPPQQPKPKQPSGKSVAAPLGGMS